MAQSLPARAPKPWSKFDQGGITVMVNKDGAGSELALPAVPDARFAVWPDGTTAILAPNDGRLVLIAVTERDGFAVKMISSEQGSRCRRDCVLHMLIRGVHDRDHCLKRIAFDAEFTARYHAERYVREAAERGELLKLTYVTPDDLADVILHSGAVGSSVTIDPPAGIKGWAD